MATGSGSGKTSGLLTSAEVAALFRVDYKTVGRWARTGQLVATRTPEGHLRFSEAEVRARMAADP